MTETAESTVNMQAAGTSMLRPPISCLIGILKPSGCTSMSMLDTLKPLLAQSKLFQVPANKDLKKQGWKSKTKRNRDHDRFTKNSEGTSFMAPKIGQGGTLDPLADGVLVLGIGSGTKKLQQFLECKKEYKAIGLLGTSTLSYDADEAVLLRRPYHHVNAQMIQDALPAFRGTFQQMPPLYSAIHIDGLRLFEYARQGKDLPRPVEKRSVEITDLQLIEWKDGGQHDYKEPEKVCSEEERTVALRARALAGMDAIEKSNDVPFGEIAEESLQDGKCINDEKDGNPPPIFTLQMTVSSGTYVRSVIHDVGMQVKSAAHVVRLSRTRQGDWISPEYRLKDGEEEAKLRRAIEWEPLLKAAQALQSSGKRQKMTSGEEDENTSEAKVDVEEVGQDSEKLSEWEQLFVDHLQIIET